MRAAGNSDGLPSVLTGPRLGRPFWSVVALGLATWGVANLGWMYYENLLHQTVPPLSLVRILFDTQGVFFAIALFLDKEKDSPRFDVETLLDCVQIAIVFFSGFFGLYYVKVLNGGPTATTDAFMVWSYQVINVSLVVLAAIVTLMARTKRLRALYGGLAAFLTLNTLFAGIADTCRASTTCRPGPGTTLDGPFHFSHARLGRPGGKSPRNRPKKSRSQNGNRWARLHFAT